MSEGKTYRDATHLKILNDLNSSSMSALALAPRSSNSFLQAFKFKLKYLKVKLNIKRPGALFNYLVITTERERSFL